MHITKNILIPGKHNKPVVADLFYKDDGKPKPVFIFSHGFKGFKDWGPYDLIAKKFAEENFCFVKLNFAFNGTTPADFFNFADLEAFGNNNFSKELDDLDVLITWLHHNKPLHRNFNLNDIALCGHSRGGGISILKANEDERVKKIVTWNSVNEFNKYISLDEQQEWLKNGVMYIPNLRTAQQMPLYIQLYHDVQNNGERLSIRNAVKNLNKPFLIIHAKQDETVIVEDAIEMQRWNPGAKLFLIEGGDHTFKTTHPWQNSVLTKEFNEAISATIEFLMTG